jgi:hypothetical protein
VARDPREQKFELATVDRVAPHDEPDQRIVHQLGERALGDIHNISPRLVAPETGSSQPASPTPLTGSVRRIDALSAKRRWGGLLIRELPRRM